jgi:hypothetical protein
MRALAIFNVTGDAVTGEAGTASDLEGTFALLGAQAKSIITRIEHKTEKMKREEGFRSRQ